MRSVKVEYEAGRALFEAYWNFLGSGGIVLRGAVGLVDGERLEVVVKIRSLKKQWVLVGRVARAGADGRTFVAFDPGQPQEQLLNAAWADTYQVPERRHRRFDVHADVRYVLDGREHAATLTNLSRGGCRLTPHEGVPILPVGTRVTVTGADLSARAQVRWSRGEIGLEFAEPLDESALLR